MDISCHVILFLYAYFLSLFSEAVLVRKIMRERSSGDSEESAHDLRIFTQRISNYSRHLYGGFTAQPALENTLGKLALNGLLNLCLYAVSKELMEKGSFEVITVGTGKRYEGNCKLRKYQLSECSCEDAISYLSKEKMWPEVAKDFKHTVMIPDVQIKFTNATGETMFPVTGEVKSSVGANRSFNRTLKQALVGLRNRPTSYGILLDPLEATIIRLEVQEPSRPERGEYRRLLVHSKTWTFAQYEGDRFNMDELMEFMKAIMSILLKL